MPYPEQVRMVAPPLGLAHHLDPDLGHPSGGPPDAVQMAPSDDSLPAESYGEGITTFAGWIDGCDKPNGKKPINVNQGTDVKLIEPPSKGWVKVPVEGGQHKGKQVYILASYLEKQVKPEEYKPKFETVTVILFQGADCNSNPSKKDISDRQYFVGIAKSLASARKNTLGRDLDSMNLLPGKPVEYSTGKDIVNALTIIGQAISSQPLPKASESDPDVYGKIAEVHILGHATGGIFGATHELSEGLYTEATYDQLKQYFKATAPFSGTLTKINYHPDDPVRVNKELLQIKGFIPEVLNFDLFQIAVPGQGEQAANFCSDKWGHFGVVVKLHRQEGEEVTQGYPVLSIGPSDATDDGAASTDDLIPIMNQPFANNVKIALHGRPHLVAVGVQRA